MTDIRQIKPDMRIAIEELYPESELFYEITKPKIKISRI